MGGGQSFQFDPVAMTAEEVASYLVAKSPLFEKYAERIVQMDLNGAMLLVCSTERDLDNVLTELGITSTVDRLRFKAVFKELQDFQLKPSGTDLQADPVSSGGASTAAPSSLSKN